MSGLAVKLLVLLGLVHMGASVTDEGPVSSVAPDGLDSTPKVQPGAAAAEASASTRFMLLRVPAAQSGSIAAAALAAGWWYTGRQNTDAPVYVCEGADCPPVGTDPYAIIGVPKDAKQNVVTKAYRKLAKRWHPDRPVHRGIGMVVAMVAAMVVAMVVATLLR